MHVEDTRGELANKCHIVNALIAKVAGIIVEAEGRMPVDRVERIFCAGDVKGDFRWMNFQGEPHANFLVHVKDRLPKFGEERQAFF